MSSNKTANLNLHAWAGTDPFKRAEFNENFALIDAAVGGKAGQTALDALAGRLDSAIGGLDARLSAAAATASAAGNCRIETGSYTGNGTYGVENCNSILFGFVPKMVWIISARDALLMTIPCFLLGSDWGGGAFDAMSSAPHCLARVVGKRVQWYSNGKDFQHNNDGWEYQYLGIG